MCHTGNKVNYAASSLRAAGGLAPSTNPGLQLIAAAISFILQCLSVDLHLILT
jgi:hypothetical protein